MKKKILVYVCTLLLIVPSFTPIYAAPDPLSKTENIQMKINNFLYLSSVATEHYMQTQDDSKIRALINAITQFENNIDVSDLLNTTQGKGLLQSKAKLIRFLAVKESLKTCQEEMGLKKGILKTTLAAPFEGSCQEIVAEYYESLESFKQQLDTIENKLKQGKAFWGPPSNYEPDTETFKEAKKDKDRVKKNYDEEQRHKLAEALYETASKAAAENYFHFETRFYAANKDRINNMVTQLSEKSCGQGYCGWLTDIYRKAAKEKGYADANGKMIIPKPETMTVKEYTIAKGYFNDEGLPKIPELAALRSDSSIHIPAGVSVNETTKVELQPAEWAAFRLNQKMRVLNDLLGKIEHTVAPGMILTEHPIFDVPSDTRAIKTFHENYAKTFDTFRASGDGLLLNSKYLRSLGDGDTEERTYAPDYAGLTGIEPRFWKDKPYEEITTDGGKKIYRYRFHRSTFDEEDIYKAVKDIESKTVEYLQYMNVLKMKGKYAPDDRPSDDIVQENLRKLVRYSPVAVGRVLMEHPEMASQICNTINQAVEKNEFDEKLNKVVMVGFLASGVLLGVAGLGAGAASLAFGGEVGVTAAAIGEGIVEAGLYATVADIGYGAARYLGGREAVEQGASSLAAGLGTAETSESLRTAVKELDDISFQLGISTAGGVLSLSVIKHLIRSGQLFTPVMSEAEKLERLKNLKRIMADFLELPMWKKLENPGIWTTVKGEKIYERFLVSLAKVGPRGEAIAKNMIEKLQQRQLGRSVEGYYDSVRHFIEGFNNVCAKFCP